MADREELPTIELEINTPVIVKPWRARKVTTKYGDKLMLTVKEGEVLSEIPWLPIDLANDLVSLKVMELGKWDDGNVRYSILKGAPEIAICKRQAKGDKHPHYEVELPGDEDGPEMPEKAPQRPVETRTGPAPTSTPVSLTACVTEAIQEASRIVSATGAENMDDPLIAAAFIEAAKALAATMFIQRAKHG